MSYEIVRSLRLDKKNKKLFLTTASNNIYPKSFSKWEYMPKCDDFEEKQLSFFHGIIGGSYKLDSCSNTNWRYAYEKFLEYCYDNNISTYDLWNNSCSVDTLSKLKPYYDIFNNFVEEKHFGKYYLDSDVGNIINITRKGFTYSPFIRDENKRTYDYKKAYIKIKNLSDKTINEYNVRMEKFDKVKDNIMEDLVL